MITLQPPPIDGDLSRTLARMLERRLPGRAQDVAAQADLTPPLGAGAEAWLELIVRSDVTARLRLAAVLAKIAPLDEDVAQVRRELDGSRPRLQQVAWGVSVLGFGVAAGMLLFGGAPSATTRPLSPTPDVPAEALLEAKRSEGVPTEMGAQATPPGPAAAAAAPATATPTAAPATAPPASTGAPVYGPATPPGLTAPTTTVPTYGPPSPAVTPLSAVPAALPPAPVAPPAAPVPAAPTPAPTAPAPAAQPPAVQGPAAPVPGAL